MCYWESETKFHSFEIRAALNLFGIGFTVFNWTEAIDIHLYFLFFAFYLSIDKTKGRTQWSDND